MADPKPDAAAPDEEGDEAVESDDDLREVGAESESDLSNLEELRTFDTVLVSADWTTQTLLSQIEQDNIELSPAFQRRDAWRQVRRSRFIESLIMGLPVPQIVLAERKGRRGQYIVLDGKQRLLTLQRFAAPMEDPSQGFRLRGLELREDLNGHRYEDLPTGDRVALDNQTIRTMVVKNWDRDDFLYLVFLRLNTGSVPLSPQELRQALHPGPFVAFANEFTSKSNAFRAMLRIKQPDFRMRDVELLVRFFAFTEYLDEYRGSLKTLFDYTCEQMNERWETESAHIESQARICEVAITATLVAFGDYAFRASRDGVWQRLFNRAVFDVMVYHGRSSSVQDLFVADREAVVEAFRDLCGGDPHFVRSLTVTTKTPDAIHYRLATWGAILGQLGAESVPVTERAEY